MRQSEYRGARGRYFELAGLYPGIVDSRATLTGSRDTSGAIMRRPTATHRIAPRCRIRRNFQTQLHDDLNFHETVILVSTQSTNPPPPFLPPPLGEI